MSNGNSDTTDFLVQAVKEFHWMARRYCDGRMSTAPTSFNDLTRKLLNAGIGLSGPHFARDGMGRRYDGLTENEALAAQEDMPRGHAALEMEWRDRTKRLHEALESIAEPRTFYDADDARRFAEIALEALR